MFSRTSWKYYGAETAASLLAAVLSVYAAVLIDRVSNSHVIISVISAIGGTTGFFLGLVGIYTLSHVRLYRNRERDFTSDLRTLSNATFRGVLAMYAFRIPCQIILQHLGVAPALAALIAQGLAGLLATTIRARYNYKSNIFGSVTEAPVR